MEQRSTGPYVPDVAAAQATLTTVGSLLAVELGSLPVAASTGGFIYRLRPDLGVFERASNALIARHASGRSPISGLNVAASARPRRALCWICV